MEDNTKKREIKKKIKLPLPWSWIIVITILILLVIFLVGSWTDFIPIYDIFFFIVSTIIGWIAMVIAIFVGGFFMGMYMSHRILSSSHITPFEEEMLKMRADIEEIKNLLKEKIGEKGL